MIKNIYLAIPSIPFYVLPLKIILVLTVGIPILENALSTANIPDISGDAGTPIGTVEYSLSS